MIILLLAGPTSSNGSREEFLRFATVQFISFCVAVLDMYVCVTLLGRPPAVAILLTIVIVPIISFIVMDRRVFKTKALTLASPSQDASLLEILRWVILRRK